MNGVCVRLSNVHRPTDFLRPCRAELDNQRNRTAQGTFHQIFFVFEVFTELGGIVKSCVLRNVDQAA